MDGKCGLCYEPLGGECVVTDGVKYHFECTHRDPKPPHNSIPNLYRLIGTPRPRKMLYMCKHCGHDKDRHRTRRNGTVPRPCKANKRDVFPRTPCECNNYEPDQGREIIDASKC